MPPSPQQPQGAALKMGVMSSPCSLLAAQTDRSQCPTPAPHSPSCCCSALTWFADRNLLASFRVHPRLILVTLVRAFGGKPESAPLPCKAGGRGREGRTPQPGRQGGTCTSPGPGGTGVATHHPPGSVCVGGHRALHHLTLGSPMHPVELGTSLWSWGQALSLGAAPMLCASPSPEPRSW